MEVQKNDGARDIRVSLLLNDSTLCVSVCVLRFGVFFFFFLNFTSSLLDVTTGLID